MEGATQDHGKNHVPSIERRFRSHQLKDHQRDHPLVVVNAGFGDAEALRERAPPLRPLLLFTNPCGA